MFPTSSTNDETFRRLLQTSLQEILSDVTSDIIPGSGLSSLTFPNQGFRDPAHSLPGHFAGYVRSSLPSIPSNSLRNSASADLSESIRLGLPVQHNRNTDLFLISLARSQLLKQQLATDERNRQLMLEEHRKLILQDSCLALLAAEASAKAKPSVPSAPPMALETLLQAQTRSFQHRSLPSLPLSSIPSCVGQQQPVPATSPNAPNALEALGSSLRKKNDPYIDVSSMRDPDSNDSTVRRTRGGVSTPFPEKLHEMLADVEKEGKTDIVSFFSHGRAFGVHDPDRFVKEIMPKYFKQSKWNSFARQLNLYGFIRISSGIDAGGYYHELFLRGRPNLCFHMRRVGIPQGGDRRKFKTKQEAPDPDFYSMKPLPTSRGGGASA